MILKPRNHPSDLARTLGSPRRRLHPPAIPRSMLGLKKILVPLDFSRCDHKVLQYAVPFALHFGAALTLIHIITPFIPSPDMISVPVETNASAAARLQAIQKSLGKGVLATALVRNGNAHAEIIDTARELDIDLIIVATHARKGIEHMLLGSVAEKLVRYAGCPVLVVREHEHEFVRG